MTLWLALKNLIQCIQLIRSQLFCQIKLSIMPYRVKRGGAYTLSLHSQVHIAYPITPSVWIPFCRSPLQSVPLPQPSQIQVAKHIFRPAFRRELEALHYLIFCHFFIQYSPGDPQQLGCFRSVPASLSQRISDQLPSKRLSGRTKPIIYLTC